MKRGTRPLFRFFSKYPRRHLEWLEKPSIIWVIRVCHHWHQGIGVPKVKLWPPDTGAVIASRSWKTRCRRLGNGVTVRPMIANWISILRFWQTKNASGTSFTPNQRWSFPDFCIWFYSFCCYSSYISHGWEGIAVYGLCGLSVCSLHCYLSRKDKLKEELYYSRASCRRVIASVGFILSLLS